MEFDVDERDLKAAGAELLQGGRCGLRIHGWEIESRKQPILNSLQLLEWEQELQTAHLPEMVFGNSSLVLAHIDSGMILHFNALDALHGWKEVALPPVEVPAAAKWKFRSKPSQQVILDYDYTFTTPYCGSETIQSHTWKIQPRALPKQVNSHSHWEESSEKIDVATLSLKEPILFYDEIILYEDELADSGVSMLTVKVRAMPSGWFVLLRYWLRVDGVLMRLRDTRIHCMFRGNKSVILRESCWREATFQSLSQKGYSSDSSAYSDPSVVLQRLPVVMYGTQKLQLDRC